MAETDLFSRCCRLQEAGKEDVGVNRDIPRQYNVVVVRNPTLVPVKKPTINANTLVDAKRSVYTKNSVDAKWLRLPGE